MTTTLSPPEVPPSSRSEPSMDLSRAKMPVGGLLGAAGLLIGALSFAGNFIFATKVDAASQREATAQLKMETQLALSGLEAQVKAVDYQVRDTRRDMEPMARTIGAIAAKLNVDPLLIVVATSSKSGGR